MSDKKKGILYLLATAVIIALLTALCFLGIGKAHRGSAENIKLGLDLAGGVSITYQANKENPTSREMEDTKFKLQRRVDNYSTESAVYREGKNRINVDIPGVTDANKILKELGKAGSIQFLDPQGKVVIDGSDISTAKAEVGQDKIGNKSYQVRLELNKSGKSKFAKATKENIGKVIAIVYDGNPIQTPKVNSEIPDGIAYIDGQASMEEAENLASTIRIGALPLELKELRSTVVGAKLGTEAINTSLLAGVIGFVLVLLFMIILYRIPGLASSIALIAYVVLMMLTLNVFNVTLTLPGIAGIILSIGMAVDANVIIFTRIKEEIAAGKAVRSAIKSGFDKAMSAILDGNITTLIAAAVLWFKGSGTIKGFAQTLAIGIILSLFTALVVTKFILNAFYAIGLDDKKYYGEQKQPTKIRFTKNLWKFACVSGVVILIGVAFLFINKSSRGESLNFGLDFKGGTSTQIGFKDKVPTNKEVEKLAMEVTGDVNVEVAPVVGEKAVIIRTKELNLTQRNNLQERFVKDYNADQSKITTENISGTVSGEMRRDAIIAVLIATVCMLIYIWFRFKDVKYGASAVIALLHDVLVVFMVYAVAWISVGNTFIACMLTIVGYSINATIVIFDRIRENRASMKRNDELSDVVDLSVNQTISRSLNTSITTFIMVFVLYILGVDSVKEFALPLMAGIICGAYSSICITGGLWYFLKAKIGPKPQKAVQTTKKTSKKKK